MTKEPAVKSAANSLTCWQGQLICLLFPEWTKSTAHVCHHKTGYLIRIRISPAQTPNTRCTFLPWSAPVIRQLNSSIAITSLTSGQCRLAPLIQVIQDSSHLYHFTVKLLFKLHACKIYEILKRSKLIHFFGGHYLLLCAFQVSLLTLYRDTVNVSMSSSAGLSSSLTLCKGMLLYQRAKMFSLNGVTWQQLETMQITPSHLLRYEPVGVAAAALHPCIHNFTNYSFCLT